MSELLSQISMYLKAEDILNSENMIPIENVKELIDELQQKENIIKEVREYIKENTTSYYLNTEETIEGFELVCDPEELLEILDRE